MHCHSCYVCTCTYHDDSITGGENGDVGAGDGRPAGAMYSYADVLDELQRLGLQPGIRFQDLLAVVYPLAHLVSAVQKKRCVAALRTYV